MDIGNNVDLLNNKPKSKKGGAQPGSGRPKGSISQSTRERMEIKRAFQERVAKNVDRLFNSQFNLATGEQYLLWKHTVGNGARSRTIVDTITDIEIIKAYINGELEETDDNSYYFISTKPASGQAIDSMLDRSFGKADSSLDITSLGEQLGVNLSAAQSEQLIRARAERSDT